jgi:PAS domain S-box-containing protein
MCQLEVRNVGYFTTALDIGTILKACQSLSSEIQLEQLLQTLIQIVVTNAGVDKAALFLKQEDTLELAIQYVDNTIQSLGTQSVNACQQLSIALIHYVENTLETVMTDYKTHPSTVNDPYCLEFHPQSLLCIPILNQRQLIAILYLENTITAGVFTHDRVELLKVLCTQTAISLENARQYQQIQAYAQQLEHSLNQLQTNETRFRHLAANIPGVIFQLCIAADGKSSVPFTSSGCYDLYEVSAEEMMAGQYNFRDFEYVEDRPVIDQMLADTARTLQRFRMEFRIVTLSGKVKWIQVISQPERQADGSLFWQGVVMDISDRKAAETQLQQQAQQLEEANRQLGEYSQTLEERVKERTVELTQALTDLQSTQSELIQSEKMAALGQLTANIAHEINTPLGVIRGASSNIAAAFQDSLLQFPSLIQRLSVDQQTEFLILIYTAPEHPVHYSTQEERQQRRRLQSHLAAQGFPQPHHLATQLTLLGFGPDRLPNADLLNHPQCAELLQVAYNLVLQHQSTQRIQQEVDQAARIIFALNLYSYQNETGEKILAAITDGIEVALTLYQSRLKQGIQVIRRYSPEVANLFCNPSELTQVWVNLIDNALYAMDQEGTLEIVVTQHAKQIQVEMTDSGCGIPTDLQSQVFKPFFTTKPRSEGSGLGLDIVRQIVQKYTETIQVNSQPGRTTFTVSFPLT